MLFFKGKGVKKTEILEMYKEFNAKSVYVLLNYNVILKAYCNYLKYYHGLNEYIVYNDITIDDIKPLIPQSTKVLLSRENINDIEDSLYNWTDKAIIECLWEGLSGNSMRDLVGLEENMVDHKNKQIIFFILFIVYFITILIISIYNYFIIFI